jgi:uncharacterized membrane protein
MNSVVLKRLKWLCLALGFVLFIVPVYIHRYTIGEIAVPVHLNIELQQEAAGYVSVAVMPGNETIPLTRTSDTVSLANTIVLHAELSRGHLIDGVQIRILHENPQAIQNAIDNISLFIGNYPYYLSGAEIKSLFSGFPADASLIEIPENFIYKRAWIGNWINWYGNLNFVIRAIVAPLMFPWLFLPLYAFFIIFLVLSRKTGGPLIPRYKYFISKNELILAGIIVASGFLLRFGGYVRYSAELDELASAELSRPDLPFLAAFSDPGNPPFYYVCLRLLYVLFGWTEKTGRFFSVLLGTLLVFLIYVYTKKYADLHSALLASAAIAVGKLFIIVSQNTRCYMLLMVLVVLASYILLDLAEKQDMRYLLPYTILACMIINTHYYGALYIMSNCIFYFAVSGRKLHIKNILLFMLSNVLTLVSFLPFFSITALKDGLLNQHFNSGIPQYGLSKTLIIIAAIIVFLIVYNRVMFLIKRRGFLSDGRNLFIDYSVFSCFSIIIMALLFSLKRPIFDLKYLQICFPFVVTGLFSFMTINYQNKYIYATSLLTAVVCIIVLYHLSPRIKVADVSREAQHFIVSDARAHEGKRCAIMGSTDYPIGYYKTENVEEYGKSNSYDIVYVNPVGYDDRKYISNPNYVFENINHRYGIDKEHFILIVVNNEKSIEKTILKKYF